MKKKVFVLIILMAILPPVFSDTLTLDPPFVLQLKNDFLRVNSVEVQGQTYVDPLQFMEVLNIDYEKDGHIFKIKDKNLNQTPCEEDFLFTGTYNDDGSYQEGQAFWENGKAYQGAFKNNKPSGQGQMISPNGDVYIGTFEKGFPHGQGEIYYNDGKKYSGQIRYGIMTGYGRLQFKNKDVYKGYLYMGLFHGAGVYSEHLGPTKQGLWEYGNYKRYLTNEKIELYNFDK